MTIDPSRPEENQRTLRGGSVKIVSFCRPEELRQYEFSPQFGSHANYRSLYTHRHSLELNAAQPETNVAVALTENRMIVGFGVLAYPDPDDRWAQLEPQVMMEVKAIEVGSNWRSQGVAKSILGLLVGHPKVEEKIIYMVGYSWTWDLDGTRKTAQQYRRMLIRLFEPFGFIEYQTNEPNICLKPENLFMGRLGKGVSTDVQTDFKWLRFGIGP